MPFEWSGKLSSCPLSSLFSTPPRPRSKQLNQPAPSLVPQNKLALLQSQGAPSSQKDDAHSHKEGSGGSSPRSDGKLLSYPLILNHRLLPPSKILLFPQKPEYPMACTIGGQQVDPAHGELLIGQTALLQVLPLAHL
jgi:hypothetical protein